MKTRSLFYLIFLSLHLFLTGCASWNSMVPLTTDSIRQKEGFESVAFFKVRIDDKSSALSNDLTKTPPAILVHRPGKTTSENTLDDILLPGTWQRRNGGNFFEATLFAEARPGEYRYYYVMLNYPNSLSVRVPINKKCFVPNDSLVDLGTFKIKVLAYHEGQGAKSTSTGSLIFTTLGTYDVNVDWVSAEESLSEDLSFMKRKFPALYSTFRNKLRRVHCQQLERLPF